MRFTFYGREAFTGCTLEELLAVQKRDGELWAHAEHSGSEGCYCEVAIWSHVRSRYERYAFEKFFGDEHPDIPGANAYRTARWVADVINNNAGYLTTCPVVHRMPNYEGPNGKAPTTPARAGLVAPDLGLQRGDGRGRYSAWSLRRALRGLQRPRGHLDRAG